MKSANDYESVPRTHLLAFWIISFGYMLPWTALGSLISYYKETFGADFYVKIYCLYYLPGLPIALIQYQYDEVLDSRFGSRNMYLLRGTGSFVVMIIVLFIMIGVQNEYFLLFCFMVLGVCGWLCHGTASMLAAMYPSGAIANLQIGFRFPEIFSLAATYLLSLDNNATVYHLRIFYGVTGCIVFASLVCWVLLVRSRVSQVYFTAKDSLLRSYSHGTIHSTEEGERLLGDDRSKTRSFYTLAANANDFPAEEEDLLEEQLDLEILEFADEPFPIGGDPLHTHAQFNIMATVQTPTNRTRSAENDDGDTVLPPAQLRTCPGLCTACSEDPTCIPCTIAAADDDHNSDLTQQQQLLKERTPLQATASRATPRNGAQACSIAPLCAALMLTIWSSIFQAAFFAYVSSPKDKNIEQTLYFVRLFADLLGRPLTFLPRPYFLKVPHSVCVVAHHCSYFRN